jgi:hypothetical protein
MLLTSGYALLAYSAVAPCAMQGTEPPAHLRDTSNLTQLEQHTALDKYKFHAVTGSELPGMNGGDSPPFHMLLTGFSLRYSAIFSIILSVNRFRYSVICR